MDIQDIANTLPSNVVILNLIKDETYDRYKIPVHFERHNRDSQYFYIRCEDDGTMLVGSISIDRDNLYLEVYQQGEHNFILADPQSFDVDRVIYLIYEAIQLKKEWLQRPK